jgi:hypothetical protein
MNNEMYFLNPEISLYDGDDDSNDDGNVAIATTPVSKTKASGLGFNTDDPNALVNIDPNARFDQEQVNKIVQDRLAKDRKKHEEKYKTLEKSYQELLANQALTDEQRQKLEINLEDLRKQHRSKEEQAKHEKNQLQEKYEAELQQYKEAAIKWEKEHKDYMIEKSLIDAAIAHDAFMPNQIVKIVREWTKLVDAVDESGKSTGKLTPMVDLPDIDADTGKATITQWTPMGAIERLKVLQPNLFKSNIVSGVGGNSNTGGVQPGADGRIDQSELTTAQWMKLYKEDPTKLGLKPKRRF